MAGIQQNPIDPRPQRGVAAERMAVLVGAQKRLLYGVLGIRPIAQQIQGKTLHTGPMRLVESLKSCQVDRHAVRLSSCVRYSTGGQRRPFGGCYGGVMSLRHGVNVRSQTEGIPRPDTCGRGRSPEEGCAPSLISRKRCGLNPG